MNIRFSKCCACIVALSVCFPGAYAFLENGSSTAVDQLSQTVVIYGKNDVSKIKERWDSGEMKGKVYNLMSRNEEGEEVKENCTDPSINDFPKDWFTSDQRQRGAVVLHALLAFYCFLMLAFICHDYLIPSVERICVSMNISTDVAGATFLAMASSFPEMFVNVVGTFLTTSDLGAGTVVGSAVFDTFATPACGALTALYAIPLEWRILSRDCAMYVISVGTLVIVMWDQRITWYEATSLLLLFCAYLALLFGSKSVKRCCRKNSCFTSKTKQFNITVIASSDGSYQPRKENSHGEESEQSKRKEGGNEAKNGEGSLEKSAEEPLKTVNLFVWPKERTTIRKCWFLFCWPLRFLLFVTIPDSRRERLTNFYPLTFIMCVIWIAITSYLVSWMMTVIGDTIGIPDSIMGVTFLAAGGNIPELASIVILARQGDGNMAMSNTLGANILDILLCLGLPWTIKCLMSGKDVKIVSGALSYSVLSIVLCIVVLYAVIAYFKFQLNKKVGLICLLLYTIFLVFAILVELNVFFPVNLPICD